MTRRTVVQPRRRQSKIPRDDLRFAHQRFGKRVRLRQRDSPAATPDHREGIDIAGHAPGHQAPDVERGAPADGELDRRRLRELEPLRQRPEHRSMASEST
jgi:hypothetical protein